MSKLPNNHDELNDVDIAALFAADNHEPSAELDKAILSAARKAQTEQHLGSDEPFVQRYAPLFGTAAVLMIAIGLTPIQPTLPGNATQPAAKSTADITVAMAEPETINTQLKRRNMQQNGISSRVPESSTAHRQSPIQESGGAAGDAESADSKEIRVESTSLVSTTDTDAEVIELAPAPTRQFADKSDDVTAFLGQSQDSDATLSEELVASKAIATDEAAAVVLDEPNPDKPNPVESTSNKLSLSELQSANEEQSGELEITAFAPSDNGRKLLRQSAQSTNSKPQAQLNKPTQVTAAVQEYRNSPLRWVIEIKRLFKAEKIEQATEELGLFRKKHPNSSHERLLPGDLKSEQTKTDQDTSEQE